MIMSKRLAILISWMMLAFFAAGCAELSKEAQVKCPKCGTVFKIYEGPFTGGNKQ
jgi:hypothetical protein